MSTLKSFDPSGIQFGWDSTSIKSAEKCLRYYFYKHIEGWQPRRKSVHLLFGGWYASALESYHCYVAQGMDSEEAIIDIVGEALVETWNYDDCEECDGTGLLLKSNPKGVTTQSEAAMGECANCAGLGILQGTGSPWLSDHNTKTRENLIRTIVWYLDQFGDDDTCKTVILSDGNAAVEHSFQLDADNGIVLSGHIDRLIDYDGKVYVQDQKTTGSTITMRFFDGFNPDTQMSLYTFAGRALFGIPVKGVMIDGAQIAVGFTRFERGFTFRDEGSLNEWYDEAMYTIEGARRAMREKFFPKNAASCGNYGGCEFRNVCARSPSVREQFLKADFVQQPRWDPLESR